jgi:hypothetical protein
MSALKVLTKANQLGKRTTGSQPKEQAEPDP